MQNGSEDNNGQKLLQPGEMFGDYTVEKLLGKGGMGAVYLVRAPDGESYAVKLMFPEIASKNPDFRKRFAREAEFAMKIKHKNLISVYDAGEDPDTGYCYIIMDYVPGGSVKDRIAAKGALPIAEAVSIAAQIALALEVAHRHGVIHRDIKPDNIMFDADGTPKLADLGVAKFTDDEHKTTVTTTGMIIGTPAYMAPEQMMDSHHIDARADIYALGIVLYEMLTGKRPTEGSSAVELLAKALKGEALPDVRTMRPEVSAAIAHVLSLMCAPKPEERPPTTLAVAQLLQQAATGQLKLPKKRPRAADAQKAKRPFPVAACVMGALVLGAALFGWRAWQKRVPPPAGTTGVSPVGGDVRGSGTLAASSAPGEKLPKETSPKPKDISLDLGGGVKMEMVGCPAGKFWMGLNPGEWHDNMARKGHTVEITRPFWIGKFPVLVGEWERLMPKVQLPSGVQREEGDLKLPVQAISGASVMGLTALSVEAFISNLTSKFRSKLPRGYVFRLPTEAEWEYALKANSTSPTDPYSNLKPSKESVLESFTLMEDSINYWTKRGFTPKHKPESGFYIGPYPLSGNKKPNAWGIYDMGGITAEPMLDSWVCTADEWTNCGAGDDRMAYVAQKHPEIRENGIKDPLLFDADKSGAVRIRWTRQGFNILHHPIVSRCALMYWFGDEKPLKGVGFHALMLRLVVGPDLLKERGIAPPKPEGSSSVASESPALGSGAPAALSATGENLPKETSPRPKPLVIPLGNGVDLELMGCPAGRFMMGYEGGNRQFHPHEVEITRPFWIGKVPMTYEQWEQVLQPLPPSGMLQPTFEAMGGKKAAVADISLRQVAQFVDTINRKHGHRLPSGCVFRLPTMAEWEYACRANGDPKRDVHARPFLDKDDGLEFILTKEERQELLDRKGVKYDKELWGKGWFVAPFSVGTKKPNAWGLYDMLGNVGEFVLDTFPPNSPLNEYGVGDVSDVISWEGMKRDPLFLNNSQNPVGVFLECSGNMRGWGNIRRATTGWNRPNIRGFRLVVGPDLVAEWRKTRGIQQPKRIDPAEELRKWRLPAAFKTPQERTLTIAPDVTMTFCACPAGSFMMSNVPGQGNKQHRVVITRPFWIGKMLVTAKQFVTYLNTTRDNAKSAEIAEKAFPECDLVSKRWGHNPANYCVKLNADFGEFLPDGYVFRLPTEAELEYAVTAGGRVPLTDAAVCHDEQQTKALAARKNIDIYQALRLFPPSAPVNAWGVAVGWTDTEQVVLDCLDGATGTDGAREALAYANTETDPVRTGRHFLQRRGCQERVLADGGATHLFRVCIGPDLLKERGITPPKPSTNGQDVRSPDGSVSTGEAAFKLLSERPAPLTFKLGKGEHLELMGCPAGTFTMGCDGCGPMHAPHKVTITRPFWAGKNPVTRAQWDLFMPPRRLNEQEIALGGPNGAVGNVSRKEVDEYCRQLTKKYCRNLPKGYVFRLPTIAEMEYMGRTDAPQGGDLFAKPKGLSNAERAEIAVGKHGKQEILRRKGVAWEEKMWTVPSRTPTVEVGLRKQNKWGICDVSGNVDQWAMDVFSADESRIGQWGVKSASDIPWTNASDPLFWSSEGADGVGFFVDSRLGKSWAELTMLYAKPGAKWSCLGFRVVVGPDLVKEKLSGKSDGGVVDGTRSVTIFPRADTQDSRWKKRAPWRYTMKVPPANWMEPGFRDGTWKRTNKPVGHGKDAALMRMSERWTTNDIWLRRHFVWKAAKATRVTFDMFHDENVEIYLNGTRILEEQGLNANWESFSVPIETFLSAVREGDNVLAVKVHDNGAPRYFDCGLRVEVEE